MNTIRVSNSLDPEHAVGLMSLVSDQKPNGLQRLLAENIRRQRVKYSQSVTLSELWVHWNLIASTKVNQVDESIFFPYIQETVFIQSEFAI